MMTASGFVALTLWALANPKLVPAEPKDEAMDTCRRLADKAPSAEVESQCRTALEHMRQRGARAREAEALWLLGQVHVGLGDYPAGLREMEEALAIRRRLRDRLGQGRVLSDISVAQYLLGRVDEALRSLEQALSIAVAARDRELEAAVLGNFAPVLNATSQLDKAIPYMERALLLFRQLRDRQGEARMLQGLANTYAKLGRADRALAYGQQALALMRELKDRSGEGAALLDIGYAHYRLNRYKEALDHHHNALVIFQEIKQHFFEAYAQRSIADVYVALGRPDTALEFYRQALETHRRIGHRHGQAMSLRTIGLVSAMMGRDAEALEHFSSALAIAEEVKDRGGQALIAAHVGQHHEERGRHEKALEGLQRALSMMRETGDRQGIGACLARLAGVFVSLGRYDEALSHGNQALVVLREVKDRVTEGQALETLMRAFAATDRPVVATFFGKQAVNAFQSVRDDIRDLDLQSRRSFLRSKERTYRALAELLASQGRLAEAQEVLFLLKEEELDQLVPHRSGKPRTRLSLTPDEAKAVAEYEEATRPLTALAAEHAELWRVRQRTPEQDERLKALGAQLEAAHGEFQAFLSRIAEELGPGRERDARAAVQGIRENAALMRTLRELGKGTVAVFTLAGEKLLRIILVTPELQRGYEAPVGAAELGRKVLALRESLQDPSKDPRGPAKALYDVLVAPLAADLEGASASTLMWSLDGVLRYVPVAALHDGERWMVERYRNTVMTPASAGRLAAAHQRRWRALGLGVTKAHEELRALPGVYEEIRTVVREKPDTTGVIPGQRLLDESFTREAMMKGLSSRPSIVHVASHYVFKPTREGGEHGSYLLLGDGGRFTLRDFDALPATALEEVDLLTLSACDTAMGQSEGTPGGLAGAEVDGLGMLAQQKGAAAVLATLWQVSDASTPAFMEMFYQRRKENPREGKAAALQAAQLALLKGTARRAQRGGAQRGARPVTMSEATGMQGWEHPYHWAPFVLIGNWK